MRRMNMRALVAILAVVLAVLGIASLVVWSNNARDRAFSGTETVTVWQVVKDVPAGTQADALGGNIEKVQLPRASVPGTAVTSLASLHGKVSTANLVPGEVLVTGRFGSEKDAQEIPIPKGLQEVTVELSSTRVLGGLLQRGDKVGVVTSYGSQSGGETNFAVNRALVLSATSVAGPGPSTSDQGTPGGNMQIRLALSAASVEKVVHASEFGKVWLSRQGKDAEIARKLMTSKDVLK